MGKTAFALNIARNVGVDQGKGVAIFSLEMSKMEVVTRLMCSEARVDLWRVRRSVMQPNEWSKLAAGCTALHAAPIFIDDSASLNLMEMRAKARRLKAQGEEPGAHRGGLPAAHDGRHQRREPAAGDIAHLARTQDPRSRAGGAGAGAVAAVAPGGAAGRQQAGAVGSSRESAPSNRTQTWCSSSTATRSTTKRSPDKGTAEIIIGKQRNGPIGEVQAGLHPGLHALRAT